MPFRPDRERVDREILDIIPERYDDDPDSHYARRTAHTRLILTVALAFLALAAVGVAARHLFFAAGPTAQVQTTANGVPLITADNGPIKTQPPPDERGGMAVPNRDKLIYNQIGSNSPSPGSEQLLPPPEAPQTPPSAAPAAAQPPAAAPPAGPRTATLTPAFQQPPAKVINAAELPHEAPRPARHHAAPAPAAEEEAPPAAARSHAHAAEARGHERAAKTAASRSHEETARHEEAPRAHAGGHWRVQLASLRTEAEAKSEWARIRNGNRALLGGLSSHIVRTDLGDRGIYWRIYAGPLEEAQARTLCSQLSKRNQGCIVGRQ